MDANEIKTAEQIAQEQVKKKQEREREIEEILLVADQQKGEILKFGDDGRVGYANEIDQLKMLPIDNPQEKYDLYYKLIAKMLKNTLPKGPLYKKARDLIYEEKNTFLTGGHRKNKIGIRGADGRMAYIPYMNDLINILITWTAEQGTMVDLYIKLRDENTLRKANKEEA